jgi:hypothetical protein
MSTTDQYLEFLGKSVKDKVRGTAGVVTSISFDLSGCVQAAIALPIDKDGKLPDVNWYDVQRLEVTGDMCLARPTFRQQEHQAGPQGACEKPAPRG